MGVALRKYYACVVLVALAEFLQNKSLVLTRWWKNAIFNQRAHDIWGD